MNPFTWLWKTLTAPTLPLVACSLNRTHIALAESDRHHPFRMKQCVSLPLRSGLLTPAFDGINLPDLSELAGAIQQAAQLAGLGREKRWTVALPDETSRTHIVTLDGQLKGGREIEDLLVWKVERLVGTPVADLRVSKTQLSNAAGQQRFLISSIQESVAQEYDRLFSRLGWQVGLLWPRPICEAQWLNHPDALPNQILLSRTNDEITVLILRHNEPVLLRSQTIGDDDDLLDALQRLLLFYRDRAGEIIPGLSLAENPLESTLYEVLMIGQWGTQDQIRERVQEVFGVAPVILTPELLGFTEMEMGTDFSYVAAAGGLVTLETLA
ncbi:MAG: hypothetical protein K1Y36_25305 [Blastocatellia bacterium]|nr:hypothetical protein [Blastocatellia bacterium]